MLYKRGERADIKNYRPISIIPVVAKVFEKIIYNQPYAYLTVLFEVMFKSSIIASFTWLFQVFCPGL